MDENVKQKKFTERLITALIESPEVQQEILSLINKNQEAFSGSHTAELNERSDIIETLQCENDSLKTENRSLNSQMEKALFEINKIKHEKDLLNQEAMEKTKEINSLQKVILEKDKKISTHFAETQKLNAQISALQDELSQFKESIGEVVVVYEKYSRLSKNTLEKLSNIICSDNLMGFITSCSDYKNLEGLWDYNKSLIMSETDSIALPVLEEVFSVFFNTYNSSSKNPRFIYDTTNVGDMFDDELHVKGKTSKVQGNISAVLLRGYRSAVTNNIVRKSVVKI